MKQRWPSVDIQSFGRYSMKDSCLVFFLFKPIQCCGYPINNKATEDLASTDENLTNNFFQYDK